MHDPLGLTEQLQSLYLRYLDSALPLRSRTLTTERRQLYAEPGLLWQEPLMELVPRYEPCDTLSETCAQLGLNSAFASFAACGLFDPGRRLYRHQQRALETVAVEKRHLVVTTGTGSGKTECFLLPIFHTLVDEALACRAGGRARAPAVRAMLLYPLNALAEDQMVRLRQAADSRGRADNAPGARDWYAEHLGGQDRFTFGRYTGITPVAGPKGHAKQAERLKRRLNELRRLAEKIEREPNADIRQRLRVQFPSVDAGSAERIDRWTMQAAPPDVLITNYSMLNIMLMRSVETPIFEATRRWLAEDRTNVFHLVVDELHSYRGTSGTEVAYLIRLLLLRLGLTPDGPQVRFLASSASMNDDEDARAYLRDFFGCDASAGRFTVVNDPPLATPPPTPRPLTGKAAAFQAFKSPDEAGTIDRLADALGVSRPTEAAEAAKRVGDILAEAYVCEAVTEGFMAEGARARPLTPSEIGRRVLDSGDEAAAAGLLRAVTFARKADGVAPLPLRQHLIFRNVLGMWACCDRNCTHATEDGERGVGRLYAAPTVDVRLREPSAGRIGLPLLRRGAARRILRRRRRGRV